jgi:hypothetical protein
VILRASLIFVVFGLLVAGVLYDQVDPPPAEVAASSDPHLISPSVSDPARLDGAWYCPVGSSSPGGYADHKIQISNLGDDLATASINIMTDAGKGPTIRIDMAPLSTNEVALSTVSQADVAGAVVEVVGGNGVVSHSVDTALGRAEGPCVTHASSSWYFASGRTTRDAENYLVLMNPFPEDVVFNVEFYRSAGRPRQPAELQGGVLAANSIEVIEVGDYVAREEAVATAITTVRGRLVVERLQTFNGDLGPSGAALQLGVVDPAPSWMLPAGRIHEGGDDRVIVFNPSDEEVATVDIQLWPVNPTDRSLYGLGSIPRELLPGRFEIIDLGIEADRFGLRLPYEVGVSVVSTNDAPVVVERWHLAVGVDTTLIGAGGTEVVSADGDDEAEIDPEADPDAADPDAADPDAADPDAADPDAADPDAGDPDGADPGAEETGEEVVDDTVPGGEFDVPGILGGTAQDLDQPTADAGIASSRGTEILSVRWVVPWVATPTPDAAAIIVTSTQEATVEVAALANGELQGPFRATVAPGARVIIPLPVVASGAAVIVTSDVPVSVEAQVVEAGQRMVVLPGIPTVDQ